MDQDLRAPWGPLETVPVAVIALSATVVVGVALAAFLPLGWASVLTTAAYPVLLVGTTVGWVGLRYRDAVPLLGIRSRRRTRDVVVGGWFGVALYVVAVYVVLWAFLAFVSAIAGREVTPPLQQVLPAGAGTAQVVVAAVGVALLTPIGEEVFFRGFLFGSLRARMGFWAAGSISAALFAASHLIPLLMPPLFVVGLGLAWLYERRGSLVPAIAAHAAFNVIGYTVIVMQR